MCVCVCVCVCVCTFRYTPGQKYKTPLKKDENILFDFF